MLSCQLMNNNSLSSTVNMSVANKVETSVCVDVHVLYVFMNLVIDLVLAGNHIVEFFGVNEHSNISLLNQN